jgi:UDP-N-acetylmuramoyl-tripeptide--D-alanyl-D-alanine ligase
MGFASLLIYYMHMFQLNSYKADEQARFMKTNVGSLLGRVMGVLISMLLVACTIRMNVVLMVLALLLQFMTFWGNRPWARHAKRPLVCTGRVRRLFVTAGILYALVVVGLGVWSVICFGWSSVSYRAVAFGSGAMSLLVPFLLFLCNVLNHPIEEGINNRFINEAKEIVASMPNLTVIGITGSFGKTSTKYFLTKLLSGTYNVLMTPGNYNTVLGVTKTVREQLKATHEVFVCEMGARRVKEIKGVCDIVHPDLGVITSIGAQHLETFGSMENIIHTKLELADAVPADGKVFLNYDNEILRSQKIDKTVVTYGVENRDTDFHPEHVQVTERGSEFDIAFPDGSTGHFVTPLIGMHNVLNLAGCIAVAYYMKVPVNTMIRQARLLEAVPHRLQLVKSARGIIIDDAYNSNPAGAKAALDTLKMFEGLHILVTPGMVELGARQHDLNRTFGEQAAAACDYIVLVGPRQTEPIAEGVRSAGFPESRLFIVSDLSEGLAKVDAIKAPDQKKIILLENDLPDNY